MFSNYHIISMIFSAISIYFIVRSVKKLSDDKVLKILKILTVIIFLLNPINWIYEIYTYGEIIYSSSLPLHLCSICWFLMPFAMFIKKDTWFRHICRATCATIGVYGGILGYILNVHLNSYPFFSFTIVRSLGYHYLMVLVAFILLATPLYKTKKSDVFTSFIPVVILVLICWEVNSIYGWEYSYVNGGEGVAIIGTISEFMPIIPFLFLLYGFMFLFVAFTFYRDFTFEMLNNFKKITLK